MMNPKEQKTVLALDTAMSGLSVGLIASNGYVVSRQVETQREQASLLIPTIQEVLEEAQISFKDLDLLACGRGPGSFTGLRIGLTTAKVMALSLNIPLIGLSNLEVMAHHYDAQKPLLIVLETKRQDFYAQYFDIIDTAVSKLNEPFSGDASTILAQAPSESFAIGGDCLDRFQDAVAQAGASSERLCFLEPWAQPDPIIMAQVAWAQFEHSGAGQENIEPLYLRGADISKPKNPPRQLAQS